MSDFFFSPLKYTVYVYMCVKPNKVYTTWKIPIKKKTLVKYQISL